VEMKYEDLILNKEVKGTEDSGKIDNTSSDRWETEVDELFDVQYHQWLGEKILGGAWVRDKILSRQMNEKGASYLIGLLRCRFNKNVNFSVLEKDEIISIVSRIVEDANHILLNEYEKFEINPNYFRSIIGQVWDLTYILLKIPFMGGMRTHIGDKTRTVINKVERSESVY